MPTVQVAQCETAEDVWRLARESAARRRAGRIPKQDPKLVIVSEPKPKSKPKPEPAVINNPSPPQTDEEIIAEIRRLSDELERRNVITAPPPTPTLRSIIHAVAEAFGLLEHDLLAERRDARNVHARQISYLLCKILTFHSLPAVGKAHNRDHSTILHGVRKVGWLRTPLQALHTQFDPPAAWAASAARLHPLPTVTRDYGRRLDKRLKQEEP